MTTLRNIVDLALLANAFAVAIVLLKGLQEPHVIYTYSMTTAVLAVAYLILNKFHPARMSLTAAS